MDEGLLLKVKKCLRWQHPTLNSQPKPSTIPHLARFPTPPYNQGMSYRTFKRVLGETNLERKCRWWFGTSLVILLTLSFTWYGQRTDKLVDDRIKTLSEELYRAGWQKLHIEKLSAIEGPATAKREAGRTGDLYKDLGKS